MGGWLSEREATLEKRDGATEAKARVVVKSGICGICPAGCWVKVAELWVSSGLGRGLGIPCESGARW